MIVALGQELGVGALFKATQMNGAWSAVMVPGAVARVRNLIFCSRFSIKSENVDTCLHLWGVFGVTWRLQDSASSTCLTADDEALVYKGNKRRRCVLCIVT